MILTPANDLPRAVAYAAMQHDEQVRKGTDVSYVSHLMAVSALVVEHGGTVEQAIAGHPRAWR